MLGIEDYASPQYELPLGSIQSFCNILYPHSAFRLEACTLGARIHDPDALKYSPSHQLGQHPIERTLGVLFVIDIDDEVSMNFNDL